MGPHGWVTGIWMGAVFSVWFVAIVEVPRCPTYPTSSECCGWLNACNGLIGPDRGIIQVKFMQYKKLNVLKIMILKSTKEHDQVC